MPERIEFSQQVRTAEEAGNALSISKERIVKSVLLMLGETKAVLCILQGNRRIDFGKIRKLHAIRNVRTATQEEVKRHTGYGIGEAPPTARGDLEVILDRRVLEQETVYGGGGSASSLLRITPNEIVGTGKVNVKEISEE